MKIMVINSCGKKKLGTHDQQPTCEDLDTKEKREKILAKYRDISYPAGELYTGNQAKTVRKAIMMLRRDHNVDLFIISAGFGMVAENDKLPPYECSFNKMGKVKIREMAKKFGISEKLNSLRNDYDLIYLVLGKDYLLTIDLDIIQSKGSEIVVFSDIDYGANFVSINNEQLIRMNSLDLVYPLGNNLMNKASLLLNYAHSLKAETMRFSKWLGKISKNDNISRFTFNEGSVGNIKKYVNVIPITTMSAEVVRPCKKCIEQINNEVSLLSNKDLKTLAEVCKDLRAISNKKGESRIDYYKKHEEKLDDISKFMNIIDNLKNELIENHTGDKNEPKKRLENEITRQIRNAQEKIGITKSRLNPVKISVMKTLISWHNNPELLKIKTVYKPKSKNLKKSKIKEPELSISCKAIESEGYGDEYLMELSNASDYPVQNILLEFESNGNQLDIIDVKGRNLNFHRRSVMIDFIKAPMTRDKDETIRFHITLETFDDIKSIDVKMKYDNSFAKVEAEMNKTIDLE